MTSATGMAAIFRIPLMAPTGAVSPAIGPHSAHRRPAAAKPPHKASRKKMDD